MIGWVTWCNDAHVLATCSQVQAFAYPLLVHCLYWDSMGFVSSRLRLMQKKSSFSLFFFCWFCFSHPKDQNLTKWNRNQMQSVGLASLPYRLVLVLNMLKPKFLVRCKNCLQNQLIQTNYTPSFEYSFLK